MLRVADNQVDALRFQALARRAHNDLAGGQPAAAATQLEAAVLAQDPSLDWRPAGAAGRGAAARQRLDGDVEGEGENSVRQFRAYQAVAAALGEAAARAPVLAVVDDLHAADEASLALLQLLAGDLHRMPALLLFTVRDTEPVPALGQALGELLRHTGAERMAVSAFEPADVAALLEHVTGLDAEQLLLNFEPAIAAGLVTAAEGGWGFRFRHPLIHESLRASAGQVERARLHARVAAALEGISSASTPADLAQLAYHYLAAGPFGDPAKALSMHVRPPAGRSGKAPGRTRPVTWSRRWPPSPGARHRRQRIPAVGNGHRPHARASRDRR